MQREEDALLIEKAKKGNREAFSALVKAHENKIYKLSMRMVGNYDDAADITQEVFLQAFKSIKKFKGGSSFYTWLYRIAVNRCYSSYKKRGKRPLLGYASRDRDKPAPDIIEGSQSTAESPVEEAEENEEIKLVRAAVEKLPKKLYQVTVLRELEELSYEEIAQALKISKGTVMSRLFRAKKALVKSLKKLDIF